MTEEKKKEYKPDNRLDMLPSGAKEWSDESKELWWQMSGINNSLKLILEALEVTNKYMKGMEKRAHDKLSIRR